MSYMRDSTGHRLDAFAVPGAAPAYVLANGHTPLNHFNAERSVYNWKASNTDQMRASLNRALSGSLEHHVFIGDSETHNFVGPPPAVSDPRQMWPRRWRDFLTTTLGVPSGGEGVIRVGKATQTGFLDPRWTLGSGWTQFTTNAAAATNGAVATCVTSQACTTVELYYRDVSGSATASVTVDGANAQTITTTGTSAMKKLTWTGLANTTHTIVLTTTSATSFTLFGAGAYNASGLVAQNMAAYGTQVTTDWGTSYFSYASVVQLLFGGTVTAPATTAGVGNGLAHPTVLHVQLGVNDIKNTTTSAATIAAAIQTLVGYFAGAEVYLHAQLQPNTTLGVTQAEWEEYVAALYALADTLDVPLFDWHHRSGGITTALANGAMSSDGLHPTAAWQYEQGRALALQLGS